jgi:hypothetical protein
MHNSIFRRVFQALQILRSGTSTDKTQREIPAISSEEVAEAKAFFPLEKFFIFGHARSGTTVLARLVRLHPEVHCNYQAHFFTRPPLLEALVMNEEIGAWLARGSNRWNRGKDLSPVVLRAVADFILEREARSVGKCIVGDKSPSSLMDGEAVRLMHKIYPDANLVYLVRDGRDTVISHRIQAFVDFPERLNKEDLNIRKDFSHDPKPFLQGERSIFTEQGIRKAAEGWVRNVEQTHQEGKRLYEDRYLTVRYEDLLAQAWDEMVRLWGFLGAGPADPVLKDRLAEEMDQNPDAEWQRQKASEIAQPVRKGVHGTWEEMFSSRDKKVFLQIAGETLKTWGYLDQTPISR